MPCNSEYMNPTGYEVAISRVACLLDELSGKECKDSWWHGYHPSVYCNVTNDLGDSLTADLCQKLQKLDVSKYSLEMQIWWRDHQKADKERVKKEIQQAKDDEAKRIALEKLTPYERDLLGL